MRRINWFYVPASAVFPCVLYRIENTNNTEIWISHGVQQILLKTYPFRRSDRALPLRTHYGGVIPDLAKGWIYRQLFFTEQPTTDGDLISASTNINYSDTFPSGGSYTVTGSTARLDALDPDPYAQNFVSEIIYAIAAGDYDLIRAFVNSGSGTFQTGSSGTGDVSIDVRGFTQGSLASLDGGSTPTGLTFSSSFDAITANDGITNIAVPLSAFQPAGLMYRNRINVSFNTNGLGFNNFCRVSNGPPFLDHRPGGYMSKTNNRLFVYVEYYQGLPNYELTLDYFELDSSLAIIASQTEEYPGAPTPNAQDPCGFFVTKQRGAGAVGDAFVLSDGLEPDPSFNVVADKLVQFANYSDTSQYNIPVGTSFTLNRIYDGSSTPVLVGGLGVEPDKILAIAGLI